MFALGCIQAQDCHSDKCPTGVTTQDPIRQRALVVPEKAARVYHFHRNTLEALSELVASAGLDHPNQIKPEHIMVRVSAYQAKMFSELYEFLEPGELLIHSDRLGVFRQFWHRADPHQFHLI